MKSIRATRAEIAPMQAILDEQEAEVRSRAGIETLRNAHPSEDSYQGGGKSFVLAGRAQFDDEVVSCDPPGARGNRMIFYSVRADDTKRGWRVRSTRWQQSLEDAARWASEHRN